MRKMGHLKVGQLAPNPAANTWDPWFIHTRQPTSTVQAPNQYATILPREIILASRLTCQATNCSPISTGPYSSTIGVTLLFSVPVPNTYERPLSSFTWVRGLPLVYQCRHGTWGQLVPQAWGVPGIASPVLGLSYSGDCISMHWEMSYVRWLQSGTEWFPLNHGYPTWLSAWKHPQTTHDILETQW